MKILFLLLSSLWATCYLTNSVGERRIWQISEESVVEIEGTTNVSRFRCESVKYSGEGILFEHISEDDERSLWTGEVTLKSKNFDCFNSLMTKDFRATINSDKYPLIRIRFLDLTNYSETENQENLRGEVEITLAGKSKIYPISCVFLSKNGKKALLTGNQKLSFSEFEIEPPIKFLGTVKVNDTLTVNFGLDLIQK